MLQATQTGEDIRKLKSVADFRRAVADFKRRIALNAIDVDQARAYPRENMELFHEMGLLPVCLPERHGGLNLGLGGEFLPYIEAVESYSSGCSNTSQVLSVTNSALMTVKSLGTEDQLKFFADEVRTKGARFCYLGSEPTQRFTADGKRARLDSVVRKVQGGWRLNARKAFATASVGASYAMIFCVPEGEVDTSKTMIVVIPTSDPAVKIIDNWDNMGQRATTSGGFEVHDGLIPDEFVVSQPGEFYKCVTLGPLFQLSIAAQVTGMAQGALDFAIDYVNNHRRATVGFDRAADEPSIQNHIGSMNTDVAASRALFRRAGYLLQEIDRGRCDDISEAVNAVFQAKTFATRMSVDVCSRIFQVCGAGATTTKFDADRFWRNARTLTLHDNLDKQNGILGRYALGIEAPSPSAR